jgi:MFS family permease
MLQRAISKIGSFGRLEKNLKLLFLTGLIAAVALQIIQPLFPVFLQSLDASEIEISLIISLSGIAGMLLMLPAGYIMDRMGEKKMLLTGIILWAVSTFLIAFVKNWRTVAILYSFHGIADAFVGPARMAIISSTATLATEATAFGLMSLDWLIGGTLAPPVSGYLVEKIGWQVPLLAASTVFFISIIPALKLDERTKKPAHQKKENSPIARVPIEEIRFSTGFMYFMFGFLTNSARTMVATMLPLFLNNQLSTSTTIIGLFFTTANMLGVMAQVPGGLMADRYGKKKMIILLLLPIPLIYGMWGILDSLYAYMLLFVLSWGLTSMMGPATLAIVSEVFPEERKGLVFGIRMAGVRLGSASGPMIGGYLYGELGSMSPFIGAGAIFLISIPFIYFLK